MNKKVICSYCNKDIAKWFYMPTTNHDLIEHFYCDNCVPRGCSCNNEMIYSDDNIEDIEFEIKSIKNKINKENNYILVDFKNKIHDSKKDKEIIKDFNKIKEIVNNASIEQMFHFEFKPLDENGKEYPCCEYDYSENGYLKSEFFSNNNK